MTGMIDFTHLYAKTHDGLFAFGQQFTTDSELLKDCIQDVFAKFYARRDTLCHSVKNIEHYLYISLRNRINDEHRRSARLTKQPVSELRLRRMAEAEEWRRENMEHQQLLVDRVALCLDRLSPRQRQLMRLYYEEHLKYEDICRIMGLNYQCVRNLMCRSISSLREKVMSDEFADVGRQ